MQRRCMYCGQMLVFDPERGWIHKESGGGLYMQKCRDCGWKGAPYPSVIRCPACGSTEVYDDHIAFPLWSE